MTDLFDQLENGGDAPATRRARRVGAGAPRPDRPPRRRGSVFSFVAMIAIFAVLAAVVFVVVRPLFSSGEPASVTDYPGPGTTEVLVVIPVGATGSEIGLVLKDQDVVATTEAFNRAYSENSAATSIQPGTYRLMQQMSARDAVAALLDPANRADVRVTIPEGFRSDQIYQRVADALGISYEDSEAAAHDYAALGMEGPPNTNPEALDPMEGWFYPSTYSLAPGGTATDLYRQMYDRQIAELDAMGVAPEDRLRVLTIGSMAIREARADEDWARITRAIDNRLADTSGDFNGRLGIDSTLEYAWALQNPGVEMDPDEHNSNPSPYNTRLTAGLPPSPISSVDSRLIAAVLAPAEGDWTYWVTVDLCTGETRFTSDYQGEFLPWRAELQDFLERWNANDRACPLPED